MDRRFVSILIVLVLVFGGIIFFKNSSHNKSSGSSNSSQPTNHVMGEGKKNVTLVEYGDYQCPACGAYYPIVKQVVEKYKTDIFFQFRNFPLEQIHQNALSGARAAEAADMQGKFWEMHDKLYETQNDWAQSGDPQSFFNQYAADLGLNVTKFKTDFASSEALDRINADINEGNKLGANSTPTFVIDGKKVEENPRDVASFEKMIQDAIDAKNPSSSQPAAPTQ